MQMRKAILATAVAAAISVVVACGGDDDGLVITTGTLIKNAVIVDTRTGTLSAPMSVVVDNGTITRITDGVVHAREAAQEIDASGKFLVPGFNDMHTHALGTLSNPPGDFPVLLAKGITGVREAGGSPALIQAARQLNADVAAGRRDSPEVLMMPSGGSPPTTAAAAAQFVRDRKAEGADFVKFVGGSRDVFLAILQEVKMQGFHAAGHLITAVSATDAANAGFHSFEHLGAGMGLVMDCADDEAAIRQAVLANPLPPPPNVVNPRLYDGNQYAPYYQRIIDTYSEGKCDALAKAFVANDTWQAVTLIRLKTSNFGDAQEYRADPNLRYVDKTRRALWESIAQQFETTVTPSARATLRAYYELQLDVVRSMKQQGVKVLAGSDLGGGFVIPGFGLHQEFRELAAAGLTPLEVLQATTLNAAKFLGREATMGSVEEGKHADLVLLDGNPLTDVANLDRIFAVFLKGKYYSRAALDGLLANVENAYASQAVQPLESAIDRTHTH